jgi:hypothetical protein
VDDEPRASDIINQVTLRQMRYGDAFGVDDASLTTEIRQCVIDRLGHADRWLQEGGRRGTRHVLKLGPLSVELRADQAFEDGEVTRLRLIRNRSSRSMESIKQPLAALLDSHHRDGGRRYSIELASLADGETTAVGTITAPTREKYADLANRMYAGDFTPAPESDRLCHFCPYLFPCTGFSRRPD